MLLKKSFEALQRTMYATKSVYNLTPRLETTFGTWALSPLGNLRPGNIQPVLEVEKIILNQAQMASTIEKRNPVHKPDLSKLVQLFALAKQLKEEQKLAEQRRDENSERVRLLMQAVKDNLAQPGDIKLLRESGRQIRIDMKNTAIAMNQVNDELVNLVLSLPNGLDPITPDTQTQILRNVVPPSGTTRWDFPTLQWETIRGVSPSLEFSTGSAVYMEMELAAKCQKFLIDHGFSETGQVDFVKRVVLDGVGLDPNQFLRIRREKPRGDAEGFHHATYLVGGATFPAFLALFAQSLVREETMLPIRFFVIGRMYAKPMDGREGTLQSCTVQVFVACRNKEEEEAEHRRLVELMEKFYAETIGISFQTRLLPANQLRSFESKKISFVIPERDVVVGDLASVGEYVSKRLLCCYVGPLMAPKFMSLITGKFLYITDFLRPLNPLDPQHQKMSEDDLDTFYIPPELPDLPTNPSSSVPSSTESKTEDPDSPPEDPKSEKS